jgi:hypothetical protein
LRQALCGGGAAARGARSLSLFSKLSKTTQEAVDK